MDTMDLIKKNYKATYALVLRLLSEQIDTMDLTKKKITKQHYALVLRLLSELMDTMGLMKKELQSKQQKMKRNAAKN